MSFRWQILYLLLVFIQPAALIAQELNLRVPDGFGVTQFADDQLAHDIFSMTIDPQGRVVVAGRNYIKVLHDDNQDGKADRSTLFSELPKSGAHGMVFYQDQLWCTGDNSVLRFYDKDQDGKADGPPEIITSLRHSEHGANGLTIGPDGWIYLICGNDANVFQQHVTSQHSPILKPKFGSLLRINPQTKASEVLAHGFRNPYDVAINAQGRIFTVDADGERDQYLPWYTPNRLFDIQIGQHHGWVLHGFRRSWNRPEHFFDSGNRLVEIGRGSPTGVEVYRHKSFPKKYQQGVFSCCWTLGKVYFFPFSDKQAGYQSQKTTFLETTGDSGLAPVDLAVGMGGEMFLAVGGRGTQGAVYLIQYKHQDKENIEKSSLTPIDQILTAPQPHAAWSRKKWISLAKKHTSEEFESIALDQNQTVENRVRAIEVLTELFAGISNGSINQLIKDDSPEVIARTLWSISTQRSEIIDPRLIRATFHHSPYIQRAAWESLLCLSQYSENLINANWEEALASPAREVRSASFNALKKIRNLNSKFSPKVGQSLPAKWVMSADTQVDREKLLQECLKQLINSKAEVTRLEAVRVLHLIMGDIPATPTKPDVYAGYTAGDLTKLTDENKSAIVNCIEAIYPTNSESINQELLRTLAMIEQASAKVFENISSQIDESQSVPNLIHALVSLSKISGTRNQDRCQWIADQYARLHRLMEKHDNFYSRNWSTRVEEAFEQELLKNPTLASALLKSDSFGEKEHIDYLSYLDQEQQIAGMRRILERNNYLDLDSTWPSRTVSLIIKLPDSESLPFLRARWEDYSLREFILEVLAKRKSESDRDRFVEELLSVKPQSVLLAIDTLRRMSREEVKPKHITTAIRALRSACSLGQNKVIRTNLSRLLRYWSGEEFEIMENPGEFPMKTYEPWFAWHAENYPDQALGLLSKSGQAKSWGNRLETIAWENGNINKGKKLFAKFACKQCHLDSGRLGPNLTDITRRFNRADLFQAIIDPNQDVSPLFHTTLIMTDSGKTYRGNLVYESPDGTLIQTGPGQTIRIANERIIEKRKSRQSIMPQGLLDQASDRDIADLYSYLQSLNQQK